MPTTQPWYVVPELANATAPAAVPPAANARAAATVITVLRMFMLAPRRSQDPARAARPVVPRRRYWVVDGMVVLPSRKLDG